MLALQVFSSIRLQSVAHDFFTMPTLAARSTRSPILNPVCMTISTVSFSYSDYATVKTASCSYGSNFYPFGSYCVTLKRSRTLSMTSAVIFYPSMLATNLSFTDCISSSARTPSTSVCSSAMRTASLTSSKSLANLVMANSFSSSIILR